MRCWRSLVGKESRASSLFILLPFPESGGFLQGLNIPVKFSRGRFALLACIASRLAPAPNPYSLFSLCLSVTSENLWSKWTWGSQPRPLCEPWMSFLWAVHPDLQILCRALGKCKVPVWMHPGPLPHHWGRNSARKASLAWKTWEFSLSFNSLAPLQYSTEQVWASPSKAKVLSLICIAWLLQRIFSVSFFSIQGLILLHSCL